MLMAQTDIRAKIGSIVDITQDHPTQRAGIPYSWNLVLSPWYSMAYVPMTHVINNHGCFMLIQAGSEGSLIARSRKD